MRNTLPRLALCYLIATGACSGCAVPIPPSGGPEDSTPPSLRSAQPTDGAVDVSTDRMTLWFNERIDERSISSALSVFPEFSKPVGVKYKGDRIEIEFPESLLPNTTYIVAFDTHFRDAHNVALKQPFSIAFATGSTLNKGRVSGKIVKAVRGQVAAGADVFLFPIPQTGELDLEADKPVYRTQTDDAGAFNLSHLREQHYFILGLMDRNRNRILDPDESYAISPSSITLSDSVAVRMIHPLVLSAVDTESPEIRQARTRYLDEILLRFSENVIVQDAASSDWVVADSVSGERFRVLWTYPGPSAREVVLRTDPDQSDSTKVKTIASAGKMVLTGRGLIADSTGNRMLESRHTFRSSMSNRPETVVFKGFLPDTSATRNPDGQLILWHGLSAGVRFESPIGISSSDQNSTDRWWNQFVNISDTAGTRIDFSITTEDGVGYQIETDSFKGPFKISVTLPDSTYTESFVPASDDLLGELAGMIMADSLSAAITVELYRDTPPFPLIEITEPDSTGRFMFDHLPGGGNYFIRAFLDNNRDGHWTQGRPLPFESSEPVIWYKITEKIRARWETVLPDTLDLRDVR